MFVLNAVLVLLVLALLVVLARLLYGPTKADRVVAVDLGFLLFVSAVALLAVRLDAPALMDLVLVMTLVGFLSTVAIARMVERRSS